MDPNEIITPFNPNLTPKLLLFNLDSIVPRITHESIHSTLHNHLYVVDSKMASFCMENRSHLLDLLVQCPDLSSSVFLVLMGQTSLIG